MPEIEFLTLPDIAKMLKVSRGHVCDLVKRGVLPPPLKLGRSTRWDMRAVAAALEKMQGVKTA